MSLPTDFIEKQKNALLSEKERLLKEINKLDDYPDYGDQEEDNILELQDYENNESIDDNLKIILTKIDTALDAIKNGTYGQCSRCQRMIEQDRLEVMPYADICVDCSKDENK